VIPVKDLQKLMEDAEMLADVKAYDVANQVQDSVNGALLNVRQF